MSPRPPSPGSQGPDLGAAIEALRVTMEAMNDRIGQIAARSEYREPNARPLWASSPGGPGMDLIASGFRRLSPLTRFFGRGAAEIADEFGPDPRNAARSAGRGAMASARSAIGAFRGRPAPVGPGVMRNGVPPGPPGDSWRPPPPPSSPGRPAQPDIDFQPDPQYQWRPGPPPANPARSYVPGPASWSPGPPPANPARAQGPVRPPQSSVPPTWWPPPPPSDRGPLPSQIPGPFPMGGRPAQGAQGFNPGVGSNPYGGSGGNPSAFTSQVTSILGRYFAAMPTAPGAAGAAAKAGWSAAGTALAKGVAVAGSAAMGVAGAVVGGMGPMARLLQLGLEMSDPNHADSVNRVAPFSGKMQNALVGSAMQALSRDMAYSRQVEDTAVMAEQARNMRLNAQLPWDVAAGNGSRRLSTAADTVAAMGMAGGYAAVSPTGSSLWDGLQWLNDKTTGVNGQSGTGADTKAWVVGAGNGLWDGLNMVTGGLANRLLPGVKPAIDPNKLMAPPAPQESWGSIMNDFAFSRPVASGMARGLPAPVNQNNGVHLMRVR